ncbi:MAG: PQQ-binding-like beta-propeller repeat protein [Acidobacteriota bacterium]|jgi:outer membrane protein assembly factor BamB
MKHRHAVHIALALLLGACTAVLAAQQVDRDQALLDAALAGDAARVELLIGQGADPGAANRYDVTALSFAADQGHEEVVRVLLEAGADPDVTDTFYGMNPMTRAMSHQYRGIVWLLLQHGADGGPVLMSAVQRNDLTLAREALATGNVDVRTLSSALGVATARGNSELEGLLRDAGAVEELPPAETVPISVDALRTLVGTYDDPQGDGPRAVVSLDGESLVVSLDGEAHTLRHVGERSFEAVDDASLMVAFAGRGGAVERVQYRRGNSGAMLAPVDLELEAAAEAERAGAAADAAIAAGADDLTREAPINWPTFRGANAAGNGDGQGVPTRWDVKSGENIRWRTPIPGIANSSPVIWGDRIFLTTAISRGGDDTVRTGLYGDTTPVDDLSPHDFRVYALDKDSGEVLWQRTLYERPPLTKRHPKSSQANSTPAVDGGHLVVVFGAVGKLACLDHNGNLIWERDLGGALDSGWFFDPAYQWGHGSSPIIYEGMVILQADQQRGSFLAAFDLNTGDEVWRTERDEIPSWGTPTVYRGAPRDELITNGKTIRSYDPQTGELFWWLTPNSELPVATPVVGDGLIFLSNRYPPIQRIYAVRPGGSGDISLDDGEDANEWIVWSKTRSVSYLPTPILYDDLFYTQGDDGRLITYGAHTGEVVYQARIGGTGGAYVASPVIADGRIFFTSEECTVHVAAAGAEYRDIASNDMDDVCWATPAISSGLLVIRTLRYVYGIGE